MIDPRTMRDRMLNAGHFFDHLFVLTYATAAITIAADAGYSYGELIALATPGFILFGALSVPYGWLGDRYGRHPLMVVFFVGTGISSILTGLATDPWQIAIGLTLIGVCAAIYHPVGIPMLVRGLDRPGRTLGFNGVFGNLGVAAAPLVTGVFVATVSWRWAFIAPGLVSIALGLAFWRLVPREAPAVVTAPASGGRFAEFRPGWQLVLAVISIVTLAGGLIFNSTTIALPKLFEERSISEVAGVMGYSGQAAIVFTISSFAQIAAGRAVDRLSAKWLLVGLFVVQAVGMAILAVTTGPAVFIVSVFVMVAIFGQIPIIDTIVARYVPDNFRGRVYSLKYLFNLTIGASVMPLIYVLHDSGGGFAALFNILAGAALIMTVAILSLPREPVAVARAA